MPDGIAAEIEALLYDPQTSGGLLLSMRERDAGILVSRRAEAYVIGTVQPRGHKPIQVVL
jgi:selenophosphate synthase